MKKILLSLSVIVVFLLYSWHQRNESETVSVSQPTLSPTQSVVQNLSPTATGATSPVMPTSKPVGLYRDGEYTGDAADAFYGNIQVKAVINGGKITDVQFLQYPNDRSTSVEINSQAMPFLKQEAITAQNANVDIISGATDSSMAFRQSLGSALAKARI